MSPIWRTISVIAAGAAVLAGTLLLMGNLQNAGARAVQLEQSRLDAQARHWETQLEAARSALRDQIVRYDVLAVLYHPEEWTSWRVQDKFGVMRSTWTRENGTLRALALLNPDGRLHTVQGDSARLSDALKSLRGTDGADAALLGRSGALPEVLALQFYSAPTAPAARAGRIVALIEPAALFTLFSDTPSDWTLLSDPDEVLLQSGASPPRGGGRMGRGYSLLDGIGRHATFGMAWKAGSRCRRRRPGRASGRRCGGIPPDRAGHRRSHLRGGRKRSGAEGQSRRSRMAAFVPRSSG
ncbi:MAG: hypothetical protein NT025_00565 [bacterium]|nr:hypothetical protein [bacterium]